MEVPKYFSDSENDEANDETKNKSKNENGKGNVLSRTHWKVRMRLTMKIFGVLIFQTKHSMGKKFITDAIKSS